WFNLSDFIGTTPYDIIVNVDITGMTAGFSSDSIEILSAEAVNSPQYCRIYLDLAAGSTPPTPNSITLDSVSNMFNNDIVVGQPITFYLHIMGDTLINWTGIANGFRVYSPDGAQWNTTVGDTLNLDWSSMFDVFTINSYSINGMGADTIGFGGIKLFTTGLPVNFDTTAYTVTIGPIDALYEGKTICLDSIYFPPAGVWKWAASYPNPSIFPSWDGPHCFTIINPKKQPANTTNNPTLGTTNRKAKNNQPGW
ncbi:MAG: hypothetical protein ACE5D6_09505, partial [Candidatus Zixiibacteriota bacterium]